MADTERTRPVVLEVNGTAYTLELTINGIVALEELLSTDDKPVTFSSAIARVNTGSVKYMRAFVWAALQEHHPGTTLSAAGQLIQDVGGLEGLATQLQELTGSTLPDPKDVQELGVETKARPRKAQAKNRNGGTGGVYTSMRAVSA